MNYRLRLDVEIKEKFPEYRALIIYAQDLDNGESDDFANQLLRTAELEQRKNFGEEKASSHPHIVAWREAYRAFGVKPSKYLCSVEALLSRSLKGNDLPDINRVVDIYNAVSIKHVLPVGGEDWDCLSSDLILKFAKGDEPFETFQNGEKIISYPTTGEVIWADSTGVTCRAWNWRQCHRTMLTTTTKNAYFVLDALPPFTLEHLGQAGDELMQHLQAISPACKLSQELLGNAS